MLPLAMSMALWLALQKKTASSMRWLLLFGSAAILVAISKIAFIGWGIGSSYFNFTGISGHTMLAAATLPVLPYLLAQAFSPRLSHPAAFVGILMAAGIGYSRLAIQAHSLSEVVTGFLCGVLVSTTFIRRSKDTYSKAAGMILLGLFLLITSQQLGQKAPGQDIITRIALHMAQREIPFDRSIFHNDSTKLNKPLSVN